MRSAAMYHRGGLSLATVKRGTFENRPRSWAGGVAGLATWLAASVAAPLLARAADGQPEVDPKELPRIAPVSAQDAPKTFRLRKGFRLEQVAAEPLVVDPIAMSFDEDGRLYVVEMRDYPERRAQRLGRIRR